MTFRKHLRFLYEMFLPREARFPDEDFWTRSGEPVAARKKTGPPKGTVGSTSKDWGVRNDPDPKPDDDFDPPDPTRAGRGDLYDHFSKTFPEFQKAITDAAKKLYGQDFEQVIDQAFGQPGFTQQAIKDMWDGFYTDHEAVGEVGFLFDTAQYGSGYGIANYRHVLKPGHFSQPKQDWDYGGGGINPRKSRARGAKNGQLVF